MEPRSVTVVNNLLGRVTQGVANVGPMRALNGPHHRSAMYVFLAVVLAHWGEHLVQAYQVYVMGWSLPESGGALGLVWPWLVSSEWLHYAYAVVILAGLFLLRFALVGRGRFWWDVALWIQVWHHFEHLLLLAQRVVGVNLWGQPVPTSIVQLVVPRLELHLFYNAVVFAPMVVAMVLHVRPPRGEPASPCTCAHGHGRSQGASQA